MVTHAAELRMPRMFGEGTRPVLLERTDDAFVEAVRAELSDPTRWPSLVKTRVSREDPASKVRQLLQPIHRTFHLVVVEARCKAPGGPRLDPLKIESAGMVVRRVHRPGTQGLVEHIWAADDSGTEAWRDLTGDETRLKADPDPERRPARLKHAFLADRLRRLVVQRDRYRESVVQLYPLSPLACERAGATLLFGLVPTAAASSVSDSQDPPEQVTLDIVRDTLPDLLRSKANRARHLIPTRTLRRARPGGAAPGEIERDYVSFVKTLVVAYGVLNDEPATRNIRRLLQGIKLEIGGSERDLLAHLDDVRTALLDPPPPHVDELTREQRARYEQVNMPGTWPEITVEQQQAMEAALLTTLRARVSTFPPEHGGRYGVRAAQYRVRTFIRVRRDDGCPPTLVWSAASESFTIARWFEPGPVQAPTIELPNPFKDGLSRFRPNASFRVPAPLMNVLRNDPDKLLAGEGNAGGSQALEWICGFNIPIITICAFILLNIILQLLNIIFWWLPFVRICLPIRK